MNPHQPKSDAPATWGDRIRALRNIPPLLRMVWDTSPSITSATVLLRLVASVIPVGQLWVGKLIIDQVVLSIMGRSGRGNRIWVLVAYEVGLAVLSDLLSRAINLCDSLLGDKFTNHVSLRIMEHASQLDLVSFEDPVFYDKLERARRQTTARLGMLAVLAGMGQQIVTLLSLSAAVVPAFLGETRFAMLAYSILYRWTPERRELDYLRMLGASSQSAKEVKIFGLGQHLADRSRNLFERFYRETQALAIRRAASGSLLNLLPTAGYYAAYIMILTRTLAGALSIGSLTFLAGAFARSRSPIENLFSSLNNIAEQAAGATSHPLGFRVSRRVILSGAILSDQRDARGDGALGFEEIEQIFYIQNYASEIACAPVRSHSGRNSAGWHRSPRVCRG